MKCVRLGYRAASPSSSMLARTRSVAGSVFASRLMIPSIVSRSPEPPPSPFLLPRPSPHWGNRSPGLWLPASLARPPEIGPPCLRVLPARDNGQRRTEAGEEAKTHPRTGDPQAAHRRADALGGQDDRRSGEGPGGLRADPAALAEPVRRDEGRGRQAAEGAREGEPRAEADRGRPDARHPRLQGDRQGKLLSPSRRRKAVCMLQDRLGLSERR